eukprot:68922_1
MLANQGNGATAITVDQDNDKTTNYDNDDEQKALMNNENVQQSKMAFVTGGSGYVGRNLIRYLKKKNWGIRALARSEKSANVVSDLGAEPINGDLSSVEAMTNAMKSCDVCFHCAAPVEFWGNLDKYLRITRDGTGNVIKACKDSGIPKLIYLSSIVVLMSQAFSMNNLDETMDYRDDLYGTYQICKKEAEILALAANEDDKLSVVILRPP